jgi:EAL domain-containing protein (putative c-di-GMP-specific phosphodiesterase class I)
MENAQGAVDMLEALSDMGIRLAVDDFGTGYSSLSYLKRFPLNALKIDQSFVADLTRHTDGGAITRAIITLGHELGLDIIAEGVETEDQMSLLRRQHCDLVQGYLVAHPLSGPAVAELLRAQS